jgi:hypothetical protein
VKLADAAVEASKLLLGADTLFGSLRARGLTVVEGEDEEGAENMVSELDRPVGEVPRRLVTVALGSVGTRSKVLLGERC